MIEVPWVMDELDVAENILPNSKAINPTVVIASFAQTFWEQPWVDFLFENAADVKVESYYDPASMLYNVDMKFYLPPEQETMYRLQFN